MADSPETAIKERPGGEIFSVKTKPMNVLDTTHFGVVDCDTAQGIARSARKKGFDAITFSSHKNPGAQNIVVFDPSNVTAL